MKLVVVESPTKAKTISSFLGRDFLVMPSYGHVRDLPKSTLGVDIENNFAPQYVIPKKSKENIAKLKEALKKSQELILATDEDREGEAIAWHLKEVLFPNNKEGSFLIKRIVFHEITKTAIADALKHPRDIDMNLVNAQQARRVLDRLVGYKLSPFLWRKIKRGLSAGRVQSVALRLIVEREREIQNFIKEEYWTIEAEFLDKESKKSFYASLYAIDQKPLSKMAIANESQAKEITENLKDKSFYVSQITKKEIQKNPAPPFTTSTLQQEAARKLGFSAKQTMLLAQQLYENGFITYMRTDSVHLASSALKQAWEVIGKEFGTEYQLSSPRHFKNKSKGAQEAHEAIRPTDLFKTPNNVNLRDKKQLKLYTLIWKRTIASQMQAAKIEQTTLEINTTDNKYTFKATGQVILFDGFMRVYYESTDQDDQDKKEEQNLPPLKKNQKVIAKEITPIQHFTQPPPRYTDATLVKALEYYGIGRPSTYASILSTIQERKYVEKIDKKYQPTEIGFEVNDMLVQHFPKIVDVGFTAQIEEDLDKIAQGKIEWTKVCEEFYIPFKKLLEQKEKEVKNEVSDELCPHCGKPMIVRFGPTGKFLACPDPNSKITKPTPEEEQKIKFLEEQNAQEKCPKCQKNMKVKVGPYGYFLGCVDYPKCKGIKKILNKIGFICPLCLDTKERKDNPGEVVQKRAKKGKIFYACSRWPECNFIINKKPKSEEELKELYLKSKDKFKKQSSKSTPKKI
jgi:DNA topoisomerase-1